MAIPAITEYASVTNTARSIFDPVDVQRAIKADEGTCKHWTRDWVPVWNELLAIMNELDAMSLGPIAAMVRVINEEVEEVETV